MSYCTSACEKDWSKSSPSVIFKHCGGGTASTWSWAHHVSGPISSSVLAQPNRSLTCSLTSAGEVSSNTPQIRQHLLQDVGSSCISKPPSSASPIWQLNWEVRVSWSLLRKILAAAFPLYGSQIARIPTTKSRSSILTTPKESVFNWSYKLPGS